jgi:hypothetical protein
MSEMMRSLLYSVVRTNKTTHQLLKNIEDKKKSFLLSTIVPSTPSSSSSSSSSLILPSLSPSLPSSSSASSSCSSLQHHTDNTHAAAIQPLKFLKSKLKLKVHPWGDRISVEKNSVDNEIDVNTDKEGEGLFSAAPLGSESNSVKETEEGNASVEGVRSLEFNYSEVKQGQGREEGREQVIGQGQGQGHEDWPGEGLRQGRGQGQGGEGRHSERYTSGQGLEQEQGEKIEHGHEKEYENKHKNEQKHEHENEQWQLSNAHAQTTAAPDDIDLVSDLQDALGHLRVAFESNICLSKLFVGFKMHYIDAELLKLFLL